MLEENEYSPFGPYVLLKRIAKGDLTEFYLAVPADTERTYERLVIKRLLPEYAGSPDHVAYFNTLAGGIEGGHRHLADSNLDWGQDLPALDADARATCVPPRRCIAAVFGTARPEDYGTPVEPWVEPADPSAVPGPVTFYVSENRYLLRSIAHPDGLFPFLSGRQPARRVGASIRVYEFP